MNWKTIKLNEFDKTFSYNGKLLFKVSNFLDALKFHAPGLAPVQDQSGWYHIDVDGKPIYEKRYVRAFGYYEGLATVISNEGSFHIDTNGNPIYKSKYNWCGNFQEGRCAIRDKDNSYFHIDKQGKQPYQETYSYVGDYKYGFACVMNNQQLFTHIDKQGKKLHNKWFLDLGVYHKGFATARNEEGWFHINFKGERIYQHTFAQIEPFYNNLAFCETQDGQKCVISEFGEMKLFI